MSAKACQILHGICWCAAVFLWYTLSVWTASCSRRWWWSQNDVVVVLLLLVPGLWVDLSQSILVLVDLLQDAWLWVARHAIRLVVGLGNLKGRDIVRVLRASLNDHWVVSVLNLCHLLLVGAKDNIFLRVLLKILISRLDSASQVQVVALIVLLTVLSTLVVGESAALNSYLSALAPISDLLLTLQPFFTMCLVSRCKNSRFQMFERLTRFGFAFTHATAKAWSVGLVGSTDRIVQICLELSRDQWSLSGSLGWLRGHNFDLARSEQITLTLRLALKISWSLNIWFYAIDEFIRIRFNLQVFHIGLMGRSCLLLDSSVLIVDYRGDQSFLSLTRWLSGGHNAEHALVLGLGSIFILLMMSFVVIVILLLRCLFLFIKIW